MRNPLHVPPPPTFQQFLQDPEGAAQQFKQALRAWMLRGRIMAVLSALMLGVAGVLVRSYAAHGGISAFTAVLWGGSVVMQLRTLWAIWQSERSLRETLDRLEREGIHD